MKRFLLILLVAIGLFALWLFATAGGPYPPLKDGDLIFQTSTSRQSAAIAAASIHPMTHIGIVQIKNGKPVVMEAKATVGETPLKEWANRGLWDRVAIYRDPTLSPQRAKRIIAAAQRLFGRPYDLFFSFNNRSVYCSELAYLAYREAGISIGHIQKVSELNFDNPLVRRLIERRWKLHDECVARNYDFPQCFDHILRQELVTPASIAEDGRFERIYSNYPF